MAVNKLDLELTIPRAWMDEHNMGDYGKGSETLCTRVHDNLARIVPPEVSISVSVDVIGGGGPPTWKGTWNGRSINEIVRRTVRLAVEAAVSGAEESKPDKESP